ncbi:MAG TPA: hypothetical protein VJT81_18200 [Burkholderiales bacterium]|nr:hypothetical protein [Burkholderiales bacterium]
MDHVETHVARLHLAEDRIQIGAIVVEQPASAMHDVTNVLDGALEDAQRGRIGQHQSRRAWSDGGSQCVEVDVAFAVSRHLGHRVAAHGRGGWVGAVRCIGNDDLVTGVVAACAVIGADHRYTGEFALRAGHRRQAHSLHSGHFAQHLL